MRYHWFYGYKRKKGFDMNLAQWCRATDVPFYFATQSFVGQGDGISHINGRRKTGGTIKDIDYIEFVLKGTGKGKINSVLF